MCWITYKEKYLKRKTAEKDIKVKKLLKRDQLGNLSSPIFEFDWRIGKIHVSSIDKPRICPGMNMTISWQINKGFHSCKHMAMTEHWVYCYSTWWFIPVYVKLLNAEPIGVNYKIYEAIIPKDSKYYVNEHGEYVSDKLIIL